MTKGLFFLLSYIYRKANYIIVLIFQSKYYAPGEGYFRNKVAIFENKNESSLEEMFIHIHSVSQFLTAIFVTISHTNDFNLRKMQGFCRTVSCNRQLL